MIRKHVIPKDSSLTLRMTQVYHPEGCAAESKDPKDSSLTLRMTIRAGSSASDLNDILVNKYKLYPTESISYHFHKAYFYHLTFFQLGPGRIFLFLDSSAASYADIQANSFQCLNSFGNSSVGKIRHGYDRLCHVFFGI